MNTQLYDQIKANAKTWTAYSPEDHPFKELTEKEIEGKMGLRLNSRPSDQIIPNLYNDVNTVLRNLGFDLRDVAKALGDYLP